MPSELHASVIRERSMAQTITRSISRAGSRRSSVEITQNSQCYRGKDLKVKHLGGDQDFTTTTTILNKCGDSHAHHPRRGVCCRTPWFGHGIPTALTVYSHRMNPVLRYDRSTIYTIIPTYKHHVRTHYNTTVWVRFP
jgi:hypothetical protein